MADTKLWFKSKTYGWGWQPASKEGWIVAGMYTLLLILSAIVIALVWPQWFGPLWIGCVLFLLIVFLIICIKKGEKPRWRWGKDT